MNNNPYGRNYVPNYSINQQNQNMYEQSMYEQIDNQINQLVGIRNQIRNNSQQQSNQQHQPTAINQTFQLAPNGSSGMKFATSMDEVGKEVVFFDTPFFSKDMSVVWIKNAKGEIKAYELNEIIEKDEKDMQIELLQAEQKEKEDTINSLQAQLNELKGMIVNEQSNTNAVTKQVTTNTSTDNESIGEPVKKSKSTSISRVSTSKKE